jgi:hypothetical protein
MVMVSNIKLFLDILGVIKSEDIPLQNIGIAVRIVKENWSKESKYLKVLSDLNGQLTPKLCLT